MRLTIRISTAGERWMARFPNAETSPADMADGNGRIDEAKVRAFFQAGVDEHYVTFGKDDKGVLCCAYEFCWQLSSCIRRMEASAEHDCTTVAESAQDRRLEARMNRAKFAYCRMDFDRLANGDIRVRVGCANPKEVAGPALRSVRTFAVDAVRIMSHIAREIEKSTGGKATIRVAEAAGAEGVLDEAMQKDLAQHAAEVYEGCTRRCNGYCSPINPDCPCYRAGKCHDPREAK